MGRRNIRRRTVTAIVVMAAAMLGLLLPRVFVAPASAAALPPRFDVGVAGLIDDGTFAEIELICNSGTVTSWDTTANATDDANFFVSGAAADARCSATLSDAVVGYVRYTSTCEGVALAQGSCTFTFVEDTVDALVSITDSRDPAPFRTGPFGGGVEHSYVVTVGVADDRDGIDETARDVRLAVQLPPSFVVRDIDEEGVDGVDLDSDGFDDTDYGCRYVGSPSSTAGGTVECDLFDMRESGTPQPGYGGNLPPVRRFLIVGSVLPGAPTNISPGVAAVRGCPGDLCAQATVRWGATGSATENEGTNLAPSSFAVQLVPASPLPSLPDTALASFRPATVFRARVQNTGLLPATGVGILPVVRGPDGDVGIDLPTLNCDPTVISSIAPGETVNATCVVLASGSLFVSISVRGTVGGVTSVLGTDGASVLADMSDDVVIKTAFAGQTPDIYSDDSQVVAPGGLARYRIYVGPFAEFPSGSGGSLDADGVLVDPEVSRCRSIAGGVVGAWFPLPLDYEAADDSLVLECEGAAPPAATGVPYGVNEAYREFCLGCDVIEADTSLVRTSRSFFTHQPVPPYGVFVKGESAEFWVVYLADSPQTNVTFTNPLPAGMSSDCGRTIGAVAAFTLVSFRCSVNGVTSNWLNRIDVSYSIDGTTATLTDEVNTLVVDPALTLTKTPVTGQDTLAGDAASFATSVTATGAAPLVFHTVELRDPLVSGCDSELEALAVGQSRTTSCTADPVDESFVNQVTARAWPEVQIGQICVVRFCPSYRVLLRRVTATASSAVRVDDSATVTVTSPGTVAEGNAGSTPRAFTITLSRALARPARINYSVGGGTATLGTDYSVTGGATGTLTIPAGSTSATVVVNVNGDLQFEPDENLTLTLTAPNPAPPTLTLASPSSSMVIDNDDPPTAPTLRVNPVSVSEGSGRRTVNAIVTLTPPPNGDPILSAVTVVVDTADDPTLADAAATAGSDYDALTPTLLTFPVGATSRTVELTINGDAIAETDESFLVRLSSPVNALLATTQAYVTIVNDDITVDRGTTTTTRPNSTTTSTSSTTSTTAPTTTAPTTTTTTPTTSTTTTEPDRREALVQVTGCNGDVTLVPLSQGLAQVSTTCPPPTAPATTTTTTIAATTTTTPNTIVVITTTLAPSTTSTTTTTTTTTTTRPPTTTTSTTTTRPPTTTTTSTTTTTRPRPTTTVQVLGTQVVNTTEPPPTVTTSTSTTTAPPPPSRPPSLKVEPGSARAGTTVLVTGAGFAPNAQVTLKFSQGLGNATTQADAEGQFRVTMLVFRNDILGPRQVVWTDDPTVSARLIVSGSVQPGGDQSTPRVRYGR